MTDRSLLSTAVFSLILVMAASHALAQAPALEWQAAYGGTDGDFAEDIRQTSDGGYIVVGTARSADGQVIGFQGWDDIWVLKLDAGGTIEWQRTLGGSLWDDAAAVELTSDGGYLVLGQTTSNDGDVTGNHGDYDAWVVKLNASGDLLWQKCLGGSGEERAYAIHGTSDGGYIAVASTTSSDGDVTLCQGWDDAWLIKLSEAGDIQWQRSYGGSSWDDVYEVEQTSDGGYIMGGVTSSTDGDVWGVHGGEDGWVMKVDAVGNLQWQRALGGTSAENFYSVHQMDAGGYIVAGWTYSVNGDVVGWHEGYEDTEGGPEPDGWVVKLNAGGVMEWQRTLGGTSGDAFTQSFHLAEDGLVAAGYSGSVDGNSSGGHGLADFWAVKLNAYGTLQWQKCMGGSSWEQIRGMDRTSDGGYILAGSAFSNDGDVSGGHGESDFWVVNLAPDAVGIAETSSSTFSVSPSPATSEVRITADRAMRDTRISFVDQLGRAVFSTTMKSTPLTIDVSTLPRGLYQVLWISAEHRRAQRVVLE